MKIYLDVFFSNYPNLALAFRSVLHFKLIIEYDMNSRSKLILLSVDTQLSECHLLKKIILQGH